MSDDNYDKVIERLKYTKAEIAKRRYLELEDALSDELSAAIAEAIDKELLESLMATSRVHEKHKKKCI